MSVDGTKTAMVMPIGQNIQSISRNLKKSPTGQVLDPRDLGINPDLNDPRNNPTTKSVLGSMVDNPDSFIRTQEFINSNPELKKSFGNILSPRSEKEVMQHLHNKQITDRIGTKIRQDQAQSTDYQTVFNQVEAAFKDEQERKTENIKESRLEFTYSRADIAVLTQDIIKERNPEAKFTASA